MGTLYRYFLIFAACGSLLLGIQIPNFVDQYEMRLDAHLSEVKNNLQGYQEIADRLYDGSITTLINKHEKSNDLTFRQEAQPIRNMLDRYQHFTQEQASLATGLAGKVVYLLAKGDRELINETSANYSFNIPLNEAAVVSGFSFMVIVVFIVELLRLIAAKLLRQNHRNIKHA